MRGATEGPRALASRLLREGRAAVAIMPARWLLLADPASVTGWHLLVRALGNLGRGCRIGQALRRVRTVRPDHPVTLLLLARHHRAAGDPKQAAATLRQLMVLYPSDTMANSELQWMMPLGSKRRVRPLLRRYWLRPDDDSLFHLLRNLLMSGDHRRAATLLARPEIRRNHPVVAAGMACCAASLRGHTDRAVAGFRRLGRENRTHPHFGYGADLITGAEAAAIICSSVKPVKRLDMLDVPADPAPGWTFCVSADPGYLGRFADRYASSLAETAGEPVNLHLHVVNPDKATVRLFRDLRTRHADLRIGWSADRSTLGPPWYASARFLYAREIMARYRTGLVITDVDMMFTTRPPRLDAGTDLAVLRRRHFYPWSVILAGLVLIADTPGGRAFAAGLGRLLGAMLARGAGWTADQSALLAAVEAPPECWPGLRIVNLLEGVAVDTNSAESVFRLFGIELPVKAVRDLSGRELQLQTPRWRGAPGRQPA